MRTILIFCLFSSLAYSDQPSYFEGIGYRVTTTSIPKEKKRERVIYKKPVKIIDDELFFYWLDTLLIQDAIS